MSRQRTASIVTVCWVVIVATTATLAAPVRGQGVPSASPAPGGGVVAPAREEVNAQLRTVFGLEAPRRTGGTVVYGALSDVSTLNPLLAVDVFTGVITDLLYEPLVGFSPIDGRPIPGLADGWELAPDRRTYTFRLNRDVRWHDGVDVSAEDVVFTYDALLKDTAFMAGITAAVASYRALDPDTVEIVAKEPLATFLEEIALPIVPKHVWQGTPPNAWHSDPGSTGADPGRVVGTGPFKFEEWVQGDHVTLVRNPDYYGVVASIDAFVYRVLGEDAAVIQALKLGEIDLAGVPGKVVAEIRATEGLAVETYDSLFSSFVAYNLDPDRTPLFAQQEVRQALYYALDREAIVEHVLLGSGVVAVGTQPPLSIAYAPERIRTPYGYDPAKARALLARAGWVDTDGDGIVERNGQALRFELLTLGGSPDFEQMATYLQQAWREVGVAASVQLVPFPTLVERTDTHDFEAMLFGFFWSPSGSQDYMFACAAYREGFNMMRYCNPRYDAVVPQGKRAFDPQQRVDLLVEQTNIVNDDAPIATIAFHRESTGYATRLRNLRPTGYASLWSLPWVWVEE